MPEVAHRLAVVADDLTGAADAAAPFAARGLEVSVALGDVLPPDVDVAAVVTDNRWRSVAEAAERMRMAVHAARSWGATTLFVKIDSTLRGRVRSDVSAALDAWGPTRTVATPAFPGQGRTVRAGTLVVHGVAVAGRVSDHFPDGIPVVDADSHAHLLAAARRVVAEQAVAIGSGGLAAALAEVLVTEPRPRRRAATRCTGVLLVVGTPHAATHEQTRALVAAGAVVLPVGPATPPALHPAIDLLTQGRRVVLACRVDGPLEPDSPQAARVTEELARVTRAVVEAVPSAGLVVTGGATALAVATALGAEQLRVFSEVVTGLPFGELEIGDRRIPVVTKSGGFGAPDALCRAAGALEDNG